MTKKLKILMLVLMIILVSTLTVNAADAVVTLNLDNTQVQVGDTFVVTMNVACDEGINGLQGIVGYSQDKLELVSIAVADTTKWFNLGENLNLAIIHNSSEIETTDDIVKITFKVKDGVEMGIAKVTISDIVVDSDASVNSTKQVGTKEIEVSIVEIPTNSTPGENEEEKPGNDSSENPEKNIDEIAKDLFEKGAYEIRKLIYSGNPYEIANPKEIKVINGKEYIKTTEKYETVENKYAEIFTDVALKNVLSKKFTNIDGILYVENAWGATGSDITNLQVEKINEENSELKYKVSYNNVNVDDSISQEKVTCEFKIKEVNGEYRISAINYLDIDKIEEKQQENSSLNNPTKDSDSKDEEEDKTKTENKIPNTGLDNVFMIITVVTIFGLVGFIKYNKYKEI